MSNPIILADIADADKASALFTNRRPPEAEVNRKFYEGDHYQGSEGYMGQLPPAGLKYRIETIKEIEAGFISENVIKEVVDRHVNGILGREVIWGFLPAEVPPPTVSRRRQVFSKLFKLVQPARSTTAEGESDTVAQEADEATTSWWDQRKPRKILKEALAYALLEDKVCIRFFFPPASRNEQGQITAKDLISGLMVPRLQILTSDKAGIFVDEDTEEEFGAYVYTDPKTQKKVAELTYIQNGMTMLTVLTEGGRRDYQFDLGGRLLMYELRRDALITEQVRSAQRALNLDLTSMMRNVNLAGNIERSLLNVQRPKNQVRVTDSSEQGFHYEEVDAEILTGPGATMAYEGSLIRNDNGEVIGRANPNITFREPVPVTTFVDTRAELREAIHGQCQQLHIMISGDATVSGRSREQARGEFHSSLQDSKEPVDDCGRWMLETELRLGAYLSNQTSKFIGYRCEFNAIIEDGPVDPLDRQENRADVEKGLMSAETAMSRNGVEDTDAETERINNERAEKVKTTPPIVPPAGQQGQQPLLIG